uniref:peptide chain release factor N(5)-glutamine methyltransferase n=1 Tax=Vaginimicrobium propionicum TaxID=1871034 RepID=UPI00097061B3|nr:peptide chain release factor N(5)-glutamine methyltransferase [Vaginimicrobium propionicum]
MKTVDKSTVSSLIAWANRELSAAGVESGSVEARQLFRYASGLTNTQMLSVNYVSDEVAKHFKELIASRADGIPTQHLIGKVGFRYVEVDVGPGVFIPRPETELVAGFAISVCRNIKNPRVIELCAGSGAISKAIANEVCQVDLTAVEISDPALAYLRGNLRETNAKIIAGDFNQLLNHYNGLANSFDVVVANPPYIPDSADLSEIVKKDPAIALFGGSDGLDIIRQLVPVARELLKPGGWLVVEHDDTHRNLITEFVENVGGFCKILDHDDLNGRPRFLTACRIGER